jgi:predicted GIY-YIG superfamily endonuclease
MRNVCNNCHRVGVETNVFSSTAFKNKQRKMYYRLPKSTRSMISLCTHCATYLLSNGKPKAISYWPVMIWSFLTSQGSLEAVLELTLEEKWAFIPKEWRIWWFEELGCSLETPTCRFVLKDAELRILQATIDALEWRSLSLAMDKHMTYPEVRCPWGCGEFLHQTKKVPLEDFLDAKSNGAFRSYAKNNKTHSWVWTIRPDFPASVSVLSNDDFQCQPSLAFDTFLGPCILCCRDHNKNCKVAYIHVPSSPTGCLFSDQSNQIAQAVIKSRTLRPTKLNTFSDTYETATIMGGYDGLDCCYLMSAGRYTPTNRLALQRDALAISGREDIRHHLLQLPQNCEARNFMPMKNVQDKLRMADTAFPDVTSFQAAELRASTFVTLDDAIALQEETYNETSQVIKVFDDETGTNDLETFEPPWPKRILRVHPFDQYGERFAPIHDECNSFVLWTLVGCVMCVPSLWSIVSTAVTNNKDPKGYLMSLAWTLQVKAGKGRNIRVRKPFFKLPKDKKKIPTAMEMSNTNELVFTQHHKFWDFTPEVLVIRNQSDFNLSFEGKAVIFISENEALDLPAPNQEEWELRTVINREDFAEDQTNWEGNMFTRHGGSAGPLWWLQRTRKSGFVKCHRHFQPATATDSPAATCIAIYVRVKQNETVENRNRYLHCLGGQSILFCHQHGHPLISTFSSKPSEEETNPIRTAPSCCCDRILTTQKTREWKEVTDQCCNKPAFSCARVGCNVCVCDKCYLIYGDKTTRKIRYSLSLFGSHYMPGLEPENCETQHSELFIDNENMDTDQSFIPGTNRQNMGPHEAYECIDDLLLHDADDNSETDQENHTSDYIPHPVFASTAIGLEPYEIHLDAPEEVMASPLHVLLNHQGHLLVRCSAKLRMKRKHANFFQRIVATSSGTTVPLVYAEAVLFPDIFFYDCPDGSIPGAIPTALWTDSSCLSRYGLASMRDHAKLRLTDPSTLCCSDSRYHFMELDCLINLGLRGNDSRLVLHRGFAEKQGKKEGACFRETEGNEELYGDSIENHSNVHKLSALVAESPPHFFYTQSCNQSTCRGLRRLRQWITSDSAKNNVVLKHGVSYDEAGIILRKSAAPVIQRSWEEVIDLWMKYIIFSKEEPLHKIDWAWYRKEFQDQAGNPSHIHAILKTMIDVSTKQGRDLVLDKIRGCLSDLIRFDELQTMKDEGLIDSIDCLKDILEDAIRFLIHACNVRCQVPKLQPNGETVFVCKRPSNWLLTTQPHTHSIEEIPVIHAPAALNILRRLGMAKTQIQKTRSTIMVTHPLLKMERHIPRCSRNDGKFSPTNGRLFTMMPSSQNLQFCTGASISSYLTSYVTEMDQVAIVLFRPPTPANPNTFRAEHHSLNNTKIASVRHFQSSKRKEMTKNDKLPSGRPITHMEALTVIHGTPLVTSSRVFIHMPTSAREYRAALAISYVPSSKVRPQDLQAFLAVTGQTIRKQLKFPPNRLFTNSQILVIQDELEAPLRTDQTTYFSMRPPELRFIMEQIWYLKWFERFPACPLFDPSKNMVYLKTKLSLDIPSCEWLDGFNYKMKIRRNALLPCYEYALSCPTGRFGAGTAGNKLKKSIVHLFQRLLYLYKIFDLKTTPRRMTIALKHDWEQVQSRFLSDYKGRHLPVIWSTPVYPRRRTAFLIHVLLGKGSFVTEYELMQSGNLREAYISSGLFDPNHPHESTNNILTRYIFESLRATPGSTFQFDKNLTEASDAFNELLLQVHSPLQITPSVLYSHMYEELDKETITFLQEEKKRIVDSVYDDLCACGFKTVLPEKGTVLGARIHPLGKIEIDRFFPPPRCPGQSQASHTEQTILLKRARLSVQAYMNPSILNHRNLVVVGGPGVGKTTACQFLTLYILCMGLNVTATSLVADRSKQLGGTHFHRLISLPGSSNGRSPGQQAEAAIRQLYKKPTLLTLLKTLDCLNLDEFGVFSAEMLAILDITLRYVRGSTQFMGGIFTYCTLDHLQLMPFSGIPAMMSMHVVTEFDFIALNESVRAGKDPALQEICSLIRTSAWDDSKTQRFRSLLTANCNFVPSFDDPSLPADAVFIFGRKAPCEAAEQIMLKRMMSYHNKTFIVVKSIDEESTTAGDWRCAAIPTITRLGKKVKTKQSLILYPKAHFEFTYNEKNKFNQGQLGILLTVPTKQHLEDQRSIEIWKSPSGTKEFPSPQNCNCLFLSANGWTKVLVPFKTSLPENLSRGLQARRTQYGLKPRISSTIHACMGSTLSSVITALVPIPNYNLNGRVLDFSLWEAAQVVVLLSRTREARNIYFVGNREATINHLILVLQKTHRFLPCISQLLADLCNEGHVTPIYSHPSQFRPCDASIASIPGVYLLVSTRDTSYSYIGETNSITKRLTQHNSGQGPSATNNPLLMPWALMAYTTGFKTRSDRLCFETLWKCTARRRSNLGKTGEGLITIGQELIAVRNSRLDNGNKYRIVRCGDIVNS